MSIRRISERGRALITRHASFRPRRHYCPAGVLSIGHGHTIRPHEEFPEPMTLAEADALLTADLAPIEIYLTAVFPVATQDEFDALGSFAYCLGLGTLDRSTLKQLVQSGRTAEAADDFRSFVYANKVALRPWMAQREAERALFLGEAT